MAYLNTISFPLSPDQVTHYTTGDNAIFAKIFDTTNNLMVLNVMPGEYTPRIRTLGPTDVAEGITGVQVRTAVHRQEATIEIKNGMIVVGVVINELRQKAIDDGSYTLTVLDGCLVEMEDRRKGYTVRNWWLKEPILPLAAQARRTVGATIDERMYAGYTLDFIKFGS